MRRFPIFALVLVGCSAEVGTTQGYDRAIECERILDMFAVAHPALTGAQRAGYQRASLAYRERVGSFGAELGKSAEQIDSDKRAFLPRLRERLKSGQVNSVVEALAAEADRCRTELS